MRKIKKLAAKLVSFAHVLRTLLNAYLPVMARIAKIAGYVASIWAALHQAGLV